VKINQLLFFEFVGGERWDVTTSNLTSLFFGTQATYNIWLIVMIEKKNGFVRIGINK
jgi:hypothetical protein